MSVVVWDGRCLAADKAIVYGGDLRATTTKIERWQDCVLAWTGGAAAGLGLAAWFKRGHDVAQWPKWQEDEDAWARLIVVERQQVYVFEQLPVAIPIEDPFAAWGSGRDFAIGALAMGADAKKAVEVAIQFCHTCGCGVDVVSLSY